MTVQALQSLQSADLLACHGEPILLPGAEGEPPVEFTGIFDPIGDPAGGGGWGSEVDLTGRLTSQPNPVVWLQDADAAGVAEGAEVQIRWTPYRIVRMDPDGAGLTRCELMPASASGASETDRYR
jgi:hypothetical protein